MAYEDLREFIRALDKQGDVEGPAYGLAKQLLRGTIDETFELLDAP